MPSEISGAARRPVLTPRQREQFLTSGMAHVPGLIPADVAARMAERVWDVLGTRHGTLQGRPDTWKTARPTKLQALTQSGAFDEIGRAEVRAVLDDVFGEGGWTPKPGWGQALVTFREGTAWDVPARAWHLDLSDDRVLEPWPHWLRIFVLLAPLQPGGGGTVYLSGSHRIVMQLMAEAESPDDKRCAPLREALKRQSPWITDLCAGGGEGGRVERFMRTGETVRGVELRVEEVAGGLGDVFLMHPGVLHAAAPNARREPRLMVGGTVYGSCQLPGGAGPQAAGCA